jgi:hypothetical protein
MKKTNHISDITLNFYQMGLASAEDKQMIQEALQSDPEFQARYEAYLQTDQEIRERYSWEKMPKLAALTKAAEQEQDKSRRKRQGWIYHNRRGQRILIPVAAATAAAVLVFAGFMVFSNLRKSASNELAVTEEKPDIENDQTAVTKPIENTPVEEILITPKPAQKAETVQETKNRDIPNKPETLTAPPPVFTEQKSIIIPAGITTIVEGMYTNREDSQVNIPENITLIEKNAFAGTPLITITIGANVTIDNEAFPGNFAAAYTNFGKSAGTYTRSDVSSEIWKKN